MLIQISEKEKQITVNTDIHPNLIIIETGEFEEVIHRDSVISIVRNKPKDSVINKDDDRDIVIKTNLEFGISFPCFNLDNQIKCFDTLMKVIWG